MLIRLHKVEIYLLQLVALVKYSFSVVAAEEQSMDGHTKLAGCPLMGATLVIGARSTLIVGLKEGLGHPCTN